MAAESLPVLIVGDVHGDIERLFQALAPYPADRWHTVFVGDLVDYGMFGVGALRYVHDRLNSRMVLGNHEVALLWTLTEPERLGWYLSIGGQRHDHDEIRRDAELTVWLLEQPAVLRLDDGTLVQHCGHDGYARWLDSGEDPIESINGRVHDLLMTGGENEVWEVLSARNIFAQQPERLQAWLQATHSRRVLFGHTPHRSRVPESYHNGLAINFDGGFSRSHRKHQRASPISASVAPLQVLS